MATTELERVLPETGDPDAWTPTQAAMVEAAGLIFVDDQGRRQIAPRPVIEAFLYQCRRTGLDPWARQIYCIARWTRSGLVWTTQTGIDGFRVIAERTGKFAGYGDTEWTADGVNWMEVWVPTAEHEHPIAARATVFRKGWKKPVRAIADWKFYAQTKRDGSITDMWNRGDAFMLAKCAEALAHRKAFPNDLSGLYTTEEAASGAADLVLEVAEPTEPTPMTAEASGPVVTVAADDDEASRIVEYLSRAEEATTGDDVLAIYTVARAAGDLDVMVGWPDPESEARVPLKTYLTRLGEGLGGSSKKAAETAAAEPATVAAPAAAPRARKPKAVRPDVGLDYDPSAGLPADPVYDPNEPVDAEVVDDAPEGASGD